MPVVPALRPIDPGAVPSRTVGSGGIVEEAWLVDRGAEDPATGTRTYRMVGAIRETAEVTTLVLERPDERPCRRFRPGQRATVRIAGCSPHTVPLSSDPDACDHLGITLAVRGTEAAVVNGLDARDHVELSDPGGDPWPLERAAGRHLVVVASGFGMAWVRSLVIAAARSRARFASVRLLASFPSPDDVLFRRDLDRWRATGLGVWITVDHAGGRPGRVGPLPSLLRDAVPQEGAVAMIAAPGDLLTDAAAALAPRVAPTRIWARRVEDGAVVEAGAAG